VNESVIRQLLREIALTGDATAGQSGRDDLQLATQTIGKNVPISASQQAATQLSTERPPVEDPTYVPGSSKELGYALQALAELVPEDDVKKFYIDFVRSINTGEDDDDISLDLPGIGK
jgi:hypothetical protein